MSHNGSTMQDHFRLTPLLTLAASLPLAAGCAGGAASSECCRPVAARSGIVAPAAGEVPAIRLASHQQRRDGASGDDSDFFDPLLDSGPRTESLASPRDGADGNDDEFADPLLDDPAPAGSNDAGSGGEEVMLPDGDELSVIALPEAVALAVARAPRAEAARRRAAATAARVPQVTALDDPMLNSTSYPIRDQSLQTAGGRIQTGVQLTQRIPWLEKLGARGEVVRREIQAALTEVASAELAAALSARTAWFEAWFADRAVEVTLRNRELLDQLLDVAVAKVRTGGGQTDVLRTQLEIDRLDDRLLTLRRQRDVARADLAAVLRLPPGAELPTAAEELPPLDAAAEVDALFAAAQRCRPELQKIGWEIARDRAQRRVAALAAKPDFTAGLGYAVVTEEDALAGVANGHDNVSILFGLSLPIYRDKIRAGVVEAEQRIAADSRAFEAEQDDTLRQIRRLAFRLQTLADQLDLLENRILPRAEQTLDVSLADYRGERVGFTEVSDSYADLLRLEIQEARLRADTGVALAELERAVGCELPAAATSAPVVAPAPMPAALPRPLEAPTPLVVPADDGDDSTNLDVPVPGEKVGAGTPRLSAEPAAFEAVLPAPSTSGRWRKAVPRDAIPSEGRRG